MAAPTHQGDTDFTPTAFPLVLAVDPGKISGAALVAAPTRPTIRPALLWAAVVTGSAWPTWFRAAQAAMDAALMVCETMGASPLLVIEDPPAVARHGTLDGDHRGQKTWLGMGRRQGAWMALGLARGLRVELVPQPVWTRAMRVPSGKRGEGEHRIQEAGLHLEQGRTTLESLPAKGRIDAAESALLGCAMVRGLLS